MASNDNDPMGKLHRLRTLALEMLELTKDLDPAEPKPQRRMSAMDVTPTVEDFIELRRRRRMRGHRHG